VQQSKAMRKRTGKTISAISNSRGLIDSAGKTKQIVAVINEWCNFAIRCEIDLTTTIIIDCPNPTSKSDEN
jgi:hypothetical protein